MCGRCSARISREKAPKPASAAPIDGGTPGEHASEYFETPAAAKHAGRMALDEMTPRITRSLSASPIHQKHIAAHAIVSASIQHAHDDTASLDSAFRATVAELRAFRLPRH